ncbi:MAG: hypothetical protein IT448_07505 [Phycisphaerales bacterium]|nr:hypothetical protein [Phycisphaerales bacterium]
MNKVIQVIENIRPKIEEWRRKALKETQTRTIVIAPLLEALGWDVRDPDEVQEEFPTVDGKSVDYGLKLNKKCVLLIEAKALDDPLTDIKAVTQAVNYASNEGVVWCILTNGVTWKVYKSSENCPAPEKLMYEVSIDPRDSDDVSVKDIAEKMWRFSRDGIAKGTLGPLGEQIFNDSKVRKALNQIMANPLPSLIKALREATGNPPITPKQVKASLARIWQEPGSYSIAEDNASLSQTKTALGRAESPGKALRTSAVLKRGSERDEAHHVAGKPKEVVELYRALDRLCFSFAPGATTKRYLAKSITYKGAGRSFCDVHLNQGGLRVWLRLKFGRLTNPPDFARDVSGRGHWGSGDVELSLTSISQLPEAEKLIRQSFGAAAV